jgi:predicted Zn-dependent protease with MMP-like domain
MERDLFEKLVIKAVEALPEEFKQQMENVDITVEDWPSSGQLHMMKLKQPVQLLGLYEGIPQTKRGQGYSMVLPDKITLFQKSIEAKCQTDRKIEIEIGRVIRHEIAHHFGISDAELRRINRY